MALDFLTVSGWTMTAAGLGYAAYQTYRVKRLSRRYREQLLLIIGRANYVGGEHELVDATNRQLDDRILERYLGGWHQAGCDLYLVLVDFYLSQEDKFSYDDLRKICNTPLITRQWQERHWRSLIALRPENRSIDAPPELFTTDDRASRHAYWVKHKDDKGNIRNA